MKQLHIIIIMLAWSLSASSQDLSDSTFLDAEMEDTISGMTIKPIKKPQKLLKAIIKQLSQNMEQKSGVWKYKIEYDGNLNTSAPWTVRRNISAETGVRLTTTKEDNFSFEGPYKLTRQDSSYINMLLSFTSFSPLLEHVYNISKWQDPDISLLSAFKKIKNKYNVTVYSITDESGRGVYRVNYSPKKSQVTESNWEIMMYTYTGTAYFDSNTLRLTQVKAVRTRNKAPEGVSVFSITPISPLSPSAASLASSTYRKRYQIDYDGSGTKPIIKQIRIVVTEDNKVIAKTKVQRLN